MAGGLLLVGCLGFNQGVEALNISELDGTNGFVIRGVVPEERFGRSVNVIGDVNGDSISDILIESGSLFSPQGVHSHIIFGRTKNSLADSMRIDNLDGVNGFTVEGDYQSSVDINHDGFSDIAFLTDIRQNNNFGFIIFGRNTENNSHFPERMQSSDLDGLNGFRINAQVNEGKLNTLISPGDVSGDGIDDIVLSESFYSNYYDENSWYILLGQEELNNTASPAEFSLAELNGENGFIVDSIGLSARNQRIDFDGDGINDVLFSYQYCRAYGCFGVGGAILVSKLKSDATFPPTVSHIPTNASYTTPGTYTNYGTSIPDVIGDIDDDGTDDIFLGQDSLYGHTAYLTFGAKANSGYFPGERKIDFPSKGTENIGRGHRVGDVNADGVDDMVITNQPDGTGAAPGIGAREYILFGRENSNQHGFPDMIKADYFDGVNGYKLVDEQNIDSRHAIAAGDVNNDGIEDIVVNSKGKIFIVFGRHTPLAETVYLNQLTPATGIEIEQSETNEFKVTDLNGDGSDDLILANPVAENGIGVVYIVFGFSVNDSDQDGLIDENDNCQFSFNPDQSDEDDDGLGDACDSAHLLPLLQLLLLDEDTEQN